MIGDIKWKYSDFLVHGIVSLDFCASVMFFEVTDLFPKFAFKALQTLQANSPQKNS